MRNIGEVNVKVSKAQRRFLENIAAAGGLYLSKEAGREMQTRNILYCRDLVSFRSNNPQNRDMPGGYYYAVRLTAKGIRLIDQWREEMLRTIVADNETRHDRTAAIRSVKTALFKLWEERDREYDDIARDLCGFYAPSECWPDAFRGFEERYTLRVKEIFAAAGVRPAEFWEMMRYHAGRFNDFRALELNGRVRWNTIPGSVAETLLMAWSEIEGL